MADKYLLENGTDAFLLEDGSGVLLLEVPTTTWSPANKSSRVTLSNANLTATGAFDDGASQPTPGTINKASGKLYFEVHVTIANAFSGQSVGVSSGGPHTNFVVPGSADSSAVSYLANGNVYASAGVAGSQGSWESPAGTYIVGVALDAGAGKIWFAIANSYSGSPSAGTGGYSTGMSTYTPLISTTRTDTSGILKPNAASQTYSPPAGSQGSWESPAGTYVVGVALDAGAGKIWFAIANSYSGSPAAGTGGYSTGMSTYTPLISTTRTDTSGILKPNAASQTYSPPAGFSAWDSASANAYSLTAAVGSYAITGTAVTLRAARTLALTPGSYSLSGTATALRVGRRQVEAVGSYAITGTATALRTARTLAAAVGSYALSGTATGLKKGFNLPAAVGAYALTGTATSLRIARRQVESVGSYAVTGTATALRVARRLTAAVGSYALTGTAANLVYAPLSKVLSAAVGSYSITGTVTGLKAARRLAAAVGSYALSGSSASLVAARRLSAAPGAYSITGVASARVIQRRLSASAGAYALTGSLAGLLTSRKLAANSGSYVISGTPTGLSLGRRVSAASGIYTLLGTASSLTVARRLVAGSGVYLLTGTDAVLSHFRPAPVPPSRTTIADAKLSETSSTGHHTTVADPVRSTKADAGRTTYADKRAA